MLHVAIITLDNRKSVDSLEHLHFRASVHFGGDFQNFVIFTPGCLHLDLGFKYSSCRLISIYEYVK
jgi:hypothetical protein